MKNGIEQLSNRNLGAVLVFRLIGDVIQTASTLLHGLGSFADDLSKSTLIGEAHFGRRYEALTGVSPLAVIGGDPGLYDGSEEDAWAELDDEA